MSKIYCTNICQYRIGEVCGRETVTITSYGCHSYKCVSGKKDSNVWSTNPWDNYEKQGVQEGNDDNNQKVKY